MVHPKALWQYPRVYGPRSPGPSLCFHKMWRMPCWSRPIRSRSLNSLGPFAASRALMPISSARNVLDVGAARRRPVRALLFGTLNAMAHGLVLRMHHVLCKAATLIKHGSCWYTRFSLGPSIRARARCAPGYLGASYLPARDVNIEKENPYLVLYS